MATAKKKKPAKKRAEQYEPKLKIEGSFDDVIGVAMGKKREVPEVDKRKEEKKK